MSPGLPSTYAPRNVAPIGLLIGTLCFLIAVSAANGAPATGTEVSIYEATPLLFWIGIGVALSVSVVTLAFAGSWIQWAGSLALSGLSVLAIVALPLVRGYFFYGLSDSIRHLGAVRRLVTDDLGFTEIVYPGAYAYSGFLAALSGIPLERAMLFVVFTMMVLFVVFGTLCVRTIVPRRRAVAVAAVSMLLFLPLNQISLHPHFHTFSLTTFFTPVLLFVVIGHLTAGTADSTLPGRLSSTDLAFGVGAIAVVLYHPLAATDLIIVLGSIVAIQWVGRRAFPGTLLARSPPLYGQFLFLVVVFAVWNGQQDAAVRHSSNIIEALNGWITGTARAGEDITQRTESAGSVGLSVAEIFVKLFLVKVFYVLVAAAVVLANLRSRYLEEESSTVTTAFSVSGIALGSFALVTFIGPINEYFFRHIGFGMLLVAILAPIGLTKAIDGVERLSPGLEVSLKTVGLVALVIGVTLSMLVIFPSPYIAQPTQHVSEQQYEGHVTAIEYRAEGAAVASGRGGPRRYATAMGVYLDPRLSWKTPPEALPGELRRYRGHDFATEEFYYYIQTEHAERKELVAFRGIRYDAADFRDVDRTTGVSRIMSNGEVDVHYVEYADGPTFGPARLDPAAPIRPDGSRVARGGVPA
ncbi:hypothetical protein ACFPM1_03555 [Halorubrum rubrum]|uniref:MFS transporter n=1 Tax=Halorubrum rubrum TaxID=1126240 RepID=A0ABD5QZ60_9EURY|nr:hypothetical protein [Halorubrum rubrum]